MSQPVAKRAMNANIRMFNLGNLRQIDWVLSLLVFILASIGIMVLYSANRSVSNVTLYYWKQMTFFPVGVTVALVIMCMDYRFLVSLAPLFYAFLLGLLVLVLLLPPVDPDIPVKRWLLLGPVGFQPSELSKLALIMMLSWYFSTIGPKIERLGYFLLSFVIMVVPFVLILKQPSLGTAVTLIPITFGMLFMAGCRRLHLMGIMALGIAAMPVFWYKVMTPYQQTRVETILDPSMDPTGTGYQTIQSMISIGSGGLSGKGYMQSTQTYLSYMPENHTDFIFSLFSEEWGFMGSTTVLVLFLLLLFRCMMAARTSQDMAGALLVVGIVTMLGFHVFMNVAITVGIAPVTGLPLPFFSYGRSFYLTTMMAMGLVLSVNTRKSFF